MREDRSVVDLLDADFTFVDERLARHYGIAGVRGSRMRRVALPADSPRRGLLGHGSILTVTSAANRTSPVVRGKWVLENLLGAPPPQPPPGVETNLEKDPQQVKATSLRQRLEQHRANPACASCHRLMDPIGLTLENFDHTGKWRTIDGKAPIDASGQLVDGTKLNGPESLRRALLARSDVFVDVVAEKLLTYAVGRGDAAAGHAGGARPSSAAPRRQQYRFSSLRAASCRTPQFQMRTKVRQVLEGFRPMFITKKHLSRRTFLHGIGAIVALPLLDSMVPAQTPLRSTAAAPKTRFACFYVPHGATMDKWTPATEGTGFAFTEILKPLEPFRDRINIVSGLAHPYVAGAGGADVSAGANHTRAAAVFLTGAVPERGTAGASRRLGRSGGGAAHRPGHAAAVARAVDRGSRARLRGGVQLRLPQLDLVEVADASRCRCRTTRGWCSRSCSATAAPTPSAARGGRSRAACSTR